MKAKHIVYCRTFSTSYFRFKPNEGAWNGMQDFYREDQPFSDPDHWYQSPDPDFTDLTGFLTPSIFIKKANICCHKASY